MKSEADKIHLREAAISDISAMAIHHRKMFEEIWEKKGELLELQIAKKIEKAYAQKLKNEMGNSTCKAWIIEDNRMVISSGAVTLVSFVPNPSDLSCKVAYLHSMYTEKPYRNKRCAQHIIQAIIEHCKSNGIKRIMLNASDAGKPVYQKIGFSSALDTMRLFVE